MANPIPGQRWKHRKSGGVVDTHFFFEAAQDDNWNPELDAFGIDLREVTQIHVTTFSPWEFPEHRAHLIEQSWKLRKVKFQTRKEAVVVVIADETAKQVYLDWKAVHSAQEDAS